MPNDIAHPRNRFPFQSLDAYRIARSLASLVSSAAIRDPELRDQATRAAKSAFLNLCEGLPSDRPLVRRKYFGSADGSLHEVVGAVDLASAIGALGEPETAEIHVSLSNGQRQHDLVIAQENVAGEFMDIKAGFGLPEGLDPVELATGLVARYESLWAELTREEVFAAREQFRVDTRIKRLNELGFDVEQLALVDGVAEVRVVHDRAGQDDGGGTNSPQYGIVLHNELPPIPIHQPQRRFVANVLSDDLVPLLEGPCDSLFCIRRDQRFDPRPKVVADLVAGDVVRSVVRSPDRP